MAKPLVLPPLRRTAKDAEAFARIVHEGQVDNAGRPYIEHLERVAARAGQLQAEHYEHRLVKWDEAQQVAWLHDALEPDARPYGSVTAADLREEGFSGSVRHAAIAFAECEPCVPYTRKIERLLIFIGGNLRAILVKIADVEDNSDPERLALLPDDVRARLERKYAPALVILREAAVRLGWNPPNPQI